MFVVFAASAVLLTAYYGRIAFFSTGLAAGYGLTLLLPMLMPRASQRAWVAAWALPITTGLVCAAVAARSDWGRVFLITMSLAYGLILLAPYDLEIGETALTFRYGIRNLRRDYDGLESIGLDASQQTPSSRSIHLIFKRPRRLLRFGRRQHSQTFWLRPADAELVIEEVSARLDAAKLP